MRKKKHPEHVNHERWLVSYADFITLLFAFFVVMFAVSQVDTQKVGRFTESFKTAVGIDLKVGGTGIMPDAGQHVADGTTTKQEKPNGPVVKSPDDTKENPDSEEKREKQAREAKEAKVQETQRRLARMAAEIEAEMKIHKELAGLKVVRRANELVLRFDETILFETGDARISDRAREVLKRVGEELADRPVKIRVEGHTDNRPISNSKFNSNWELSTARATSVVTTLSVMGDVDPKRLAAVGYAEYQPLGDNATAEGRNLNRRVDFVLTIEVPYQEAL